MLTDAVEDRASHRAAASSDTEVRSWTEVGWAAARLERWRVPAPITLTKDRFVVPWAGPTHGVAALLFGVGKGGTRSLRHLTQPGWFDGLLPRPEDLAVSNGRVAGHWSVPNGLSQVVADQAVRKRVNAGALPSAYLAIVMVPHGDGPSEQTAALSLVAALRRRQDPNGGHLHVAVTVGSKAGLLDGFVERLLALGAFVLRPGRGVGGFGFHSFPLRGLADSRDGRLVCVDLADMLHVWRPGRTGVWHTLPAKPAVVGPALARLAVPLRSAAAIIGNVQLDPLMDRPLHLLDHLGTLCHEAVGPDTSIVFNDGDRPDGRTGLMDLVIVHGQ